MQRLDFFLADYLPEDRRPKPATFDRSSEDLIVLLACNARFDGSPGSVRNHWMPVLLREQTFEATDMLAQFAEQKRILVREQAHLQGELVEITCSNDHESDENVQKSISLEDKIEQ